MRNWPLHQLDVKNVFSHGNLTPTLFIEHPLSYIDPCFLNHVCPLRKTLYGLKQNPFEFGSIVLAHF